MIEPTKKDIGKRVIYAPNYNLTGRLHGSFVPPSESGVIKSISKEYVFVCFEKGDDWTGAMACLREQLSWDPAWDLDVNLMDCSPAALAARARDDLARMGK